MAGQQGITFELIPRYKYLQMLGSGGFGHVCAALDDKTLLEHTCYGDGRVKAFRVEGFRHIAQESADTIVATVDGTFQDFRLVTPPGEYWPFYVEFRKPPPEGSRIKLQTPARVAIKRIVDVFTDIQHCKYTLREIKLLRFFNHPNIISLRDCFTPGGVSTSQTGWNDVYIVNDLMDNNLRAIVKDKEQDISEAHASYFMFQIFSGVKAMHDVNVIHRDLKPHNILVNTDCELKICDFGMARMERELEDMSDQVQTIWYRAPELLVDMKSYSKPIDIWSCGTILGELLCRKALFMGRHSWSMIQLIIKMLGSPQGEDLFFPETQNGTRKFVKTIKADPIKWPVAFPDASPHALDLISKLLVFNPAKRISIEECMAHPFTSFYRNADEEMSDPGSESESEYEEPMTGTSSAFGARMSMSDIYGCLNDQEKVELRALIKKLVDGCIADRTQDAKDALMADLMPRFTQLVPAVAEIYNSKTPADKLLRLAQKMQRMDSKLNSDRRQRQGKNEEKQPAPVMFDDSFEEIFKDVPPEKEAKVMAHVRTMLKQEINDFKRENPESQKRTISRQAQEEPDVSHIDMNDSLYTPVMPYGQKADWPDNK